MFRKLMYLFLGVVGATAIACSSPMPTTQESSTPAYELVGQVGSYLRHKKVPNDVQSCTDIDGDSSVVIGSHGGTFSYAGVTLNFPSGSLSDTTTITMVALAGSQAVRFYPEGLQFPAKKQPTLTFDTDCIGNPSTAVIVYTNDSGLILENKGRNEGDDQHSLTALIAHFSQYAVDW